MKNNMDASIVVDEWPQISCTLVRLPHYQVGSSVGFLLAESQEKLEEFLVKSNYSGDTIIGVLDSETHGYLKGVVKSWPFGLEGKTIAHLKAYHYPGKVEDIQLQWSCPEGTFVAKLESEHAEFISDFWKRPGSNPKACVELVKYAIKTCGSVGIFLESDPTHPVSWSILSNYGHIVHGYTLEKHRRKGYCRIILLGLMQQVLVAGLTPALEILEGNASVKLVTEVGFVESFNSTWKQFV